MRRRKGSPALVAALLGIGALMGGTPVVTGAGNEPTGLQSDQSVTQGRTPKNALLDSTVRPMNPAAQAALWRLEEESKLPWSVEWSEVTGCAEHLVAGSPSNRWVGLRVPGGTFEEQARTFIERYLDLFWPSDSTGRQPRPEFRLKSVRAYDRALVVFTQYSQGVEVYESSIRVVFDPNGLLRRVDAWLWPVTSLDMSPSLSAAQAIAAAKVSERLRDKTPAKEAPRLVVFPSLPARLMYAVSFQDALESLVDAHTGEIVDVWSNVAADIFSVPSDTSNPRQPNPDPGIVPSQEGDTLAPDSSAFRFVGDSGVIFTGLMRDSLDFRNSSVGSRGMLALHAPPRSPQ